MLQLNFMVTKVVYFSAYAFVCLCNFSKNNLKFYVIVPGNSFDFDICEYAMKVHLQTVQTS